jgi:glycosyltransferase involved in cell wall biosynthesis
MKIAFIAAHPHLATGYSKVGNSIANYLSNCADVIYLGFQGSTNIKKNIRLLKNNVKLYDLCLIDSSTPNKFGFNAILDILNNERPEAILIYNDPCIICNVLTRIQSYDCKKFCYIDLVYEYHYPKYINYIKHNCNHIFTFAEHWKNHLINFYEYSSNQLTTIYHGIESIHVIGSKNILGLKDDDFVILSLNRNEARKNLNIVLESFLKYYNICEHRDKLYMLLICNPESKLNLLEYSKILNKLLNLSYNGVKNIKFIQNDLNLNDIDINRIYNTCDLGISLTSGEGFGLTVIEHLICNKPVVCSKLPIFEELLGKDYPFFVNPCSTNYAYEPNGGLRYNFDSDSCVKVLETVCFKDINHDYSEKLSNKFNWENLINKMYSKINELF